MSSKTGQKIGLTLAIIKNQLEKIDKILTKMAKKKI